MKSFTAAWLPAIALVACTSSTGSDRAVQDGGSDAGASADASVGDSGPPGDASGPADSGTMDAGSACPAAFAGCTHAAFVEAPGGGTVTFRDFEYTPKCLRVRVGATVTFQGDFVPHPLRQACGPADVLNHSSGTSVAIALPKVGTYGYYCLDHGTPGGLVMSASIEVVP